MGFKEVPTKKSLEKNLFLKNFSYVAGMYAPKHHLAHT